MIKIRLIIILFLACFFPRLQSYIVKTSVSVHA
jgi:hypothetical protein